MSQVIIQACTGFRGRGGQCSNCGHPKSRHTDIPLNSAGYCKDCVKSWKARQERAVRRALLY